MKKSQGQEKQLVKFSFKADKGATICVAGTFNNWSPTEDKLFSYKDGVYNTALFLPFGRHEYKFVVNGVWSADPACAEWVPDGHGSINSVLTV